MAVKVVSHIDRGADATDASRELVRFLVLAFALSWTVGGLGVLLLDEPTIGLGLGALCPAIAAFWVTWRTEGDVHSLWRQIVRWRVGARWFVVALALPAAAVISAYAVIDGLGGTWALDETVPVASAPAFLVLAFFFVGGPEEPGWRGYALPRLQSRWNALTASLVLGAIWAVWHAPLWLVPGLFFQEMSFPAFVAQLLAISVVYTWMYNSTGGSVLLVMLLHAAGNVAFQHVPTGIAPEAVLALVFAALAVALVTAYGPRNLANAPRVDRDAVRHAMSPR